MARFNDTLLEVRDFTRHFSRSVYCDHRCTVADVSQPGFFDEANRMRPRSQPIKVRDRIECDCADGVVVLRVMATNEHGLEIVTRPLQEPLMFDAVASWEDDENDAEPEQKRRGPGRPPKVAAA